MPRRLEPAIPMPASETATVPAGEMPSWAKWLAVALIAVFGGRVVLHSSQIAPTSDELVHLVAGYSYLRWHDFRLNPEHPPLVKLMASLPLLYSKNRPAAGDLFGPETVGDPASSSRRELRHLWEQTARNPSEQWLFAHEFVYGVRSDTLDRHGVSATRKIGSGQIIHPVEFLNDADRMLFVGRLPMLVFGIAVCGLVFLWARRLFGWPAGLFALALSTLDSNLIAHSTLVTNDVALTAMAVATVYGLWRTSRGDRRFIALTVICFSLAFVTKFSSVLLVPVVVLLASAEVGHGLTRNRSTGRPLRRVAHLLLTLGLCALASILMIWAFYLFRYSGMSPDLDPLPMPVEQKLRQTVSLEAAFDPSVEGRDYLGVSHRALAWIDRLGLLPQAYTSGLAEARLQAVSRVSFLRGEISLRGFPTYFLWSFALKTPLVTMLLMALGGVIVLPRSGWRNSLFLLLPVTVFLAAASMSNLNIGHRHILAIYPFVWILAGGAGGAIVERLARGRLSGILGLLAVIAIGSTWVFAPLGRVSTAATKPLDYFNELAGGPSNGYKHLVDSNLDWGQSLKELRDWLDSEEVPGAINLCYFGAADPRFYQITYVRMPCAYPYAPPFTHRGPFPEPKRPGILVVSATHLQGAFATDYLRERLEALLEEAMPVGRIGNGLFVYFLHREDS